MCRKCGQKHKNFLSNLSQKSDTDCNALEMNAI